MNLHGVTTGNNVFKEVGKTLIRHNLKWNLLRCITTKTVAKCVHSRKRSSWNL